MKKMILALGLMALVSAPLSAELKYTTHMEIKKVDRGPRAAGQPDDRHDGRCDHEADGAGRAPPTCVPGRREGARIEYLQAAMGQPAGTVNLVRRWHADRDEPEREDLLENHRARQRSRTCSAAGIPSPDVTAKRTGQFETIAGAKCEVITFDWKMALPIPEAGALEPSRRTFRPRWR